MCIRMHLHVSISIRYACAWNHMPPLRIRMAKLWTCVPRKSETILAARQAIVTKPTPHSKSAQIDNQRTSYWTSATWRVLLRFLSEQFGRGFAFAFRLHDVWFVRRRSWFWIRYWHFLEFWQAITNIRWDRQGGCGRRSCSISGGRCRVHADVARRRFEGGT